MRSEKVEILRRILENKKRPLSIAEIARTSGLSRATVARYLDQMHLSGQVRLFEIGKAKKYLLTSEISSHNLCDLSTNFVLVLDQDLKIVFINEAYLKFSNISKQLIIGKRIESIHLDIFASPDILLLLKKYQGDGVEYHTIELEQKNVRQIYSITLARVQFASNNQAIALIAHDITSKRKMEEENRLLASIVDSTQDAIIGIGEDLSIISWNNGAERMLGYNREDMLGKNVTMLHPMDSKDNYLTFLETILQGETVNQYETQQVCKNGTIIDASFTISHIFDKEKKCLGISVIIRDITEQKSIETALKNAKEKLNILSSITRHDILNQLQALDIFTDLLTKNRHLEEKELEYLRYIDVCSRNIREHINFSKDYQDLGDNAPIWQHIETIVKMAAVDNIPESVQLSIQTSDYEVFADSMLMMVFFNLIDNSKRHGKHVTKITISLFPDKNGGVLVYEDDGVGVAESMKSDIFDKGVGENSGLGLFLVREILAITNLCIKETGKEGHGVRFEIIIPDRGLRRSIR